MRLFSDRNLDDSPAKRRVYAAFEVVYTAVDFSAALCFIAGSILFFSKDTQTTGTWLFLAGSILFAGKPTLRLARELKLAAMGDAKDLAKRFGPP